MNWIIGALLAGSTALAGVASFNGWGLAAPRKNPLSVRHGSRHVKATPYYHHFGRRHGHYSGK